MLYTGYIIVAMAQYHRQHIRHLHTHSHKNAATRTRALNRQHNIAFVRMYALCISIDSGEAAELQELYIYLYTGCMDTLFRSDARALIDLPTTGTFFFSSYHAVACVCVCV